MFGDPVQIVENSNTSGEASVSFSAPTAGNLIEVYVGRAATHSAGGAWDVPSGWNGGPDSGISNGNIGAKRFWKISDGTETSFASADTNEAGNWRCVLIEYEGPFEASPLDQSAENEDNLATVVTSQTTGTTGTTSQADELAIGFWAADSAGNVDGGRAYTNSFAEVVFSSDTVSAARAAVVVASKVLTATGTVECTFSTTDTGDEMYGSMLTFKKAASGGVTVSPAAASAVGVVIAPVVELGSVAVGPAAATAVVETISPNTILGSISIAPDPAVAVVNAVPPTAVLGDVIITPSPVTAVAEVVAPGVVLGSIVVLPSPVTAVVSTVTPTIVMGSTVATPLPATAVAAVAEPTVIAGSPVVFVDAEIEGPGLAGTILGPGLLAEVEGPGLLASIQGA